MVSKLVMVDVWYVTDDHPDVFQSFTWQTVDEAPEFKRAFSFIQQLGEIGEIHHWQLKEFDRPFPEYDMRLVMPMSETEH